MLEACHVLICHCCFLVPTGDPTLLMREMRKDGLAIKRNAMGRQVDPHANNQVRSFAVYFQFFGFDMTTNMKIGNRVRGSV